MENLIKILENELRRAFSGAGYDEGYARVVASNRPDLCEFQCNGAWLRLSSIIKRRS